MSKRLVFVLLLVPAFTAAGWRATEFYRVRHPVSGREITVPSRDGPNAMLVNGWKTTPAGRQLKSGDMILSGQVSPDGKLFAFTNTGYTMHALHLVDLSTEKEIATFQVEQAWSGLAFTPNGKRIFISAGAGYRGADILYFDRWDNGGWQFARQGYTLRGATKDSTAVSWLGVSPDGTLLYALNNSDGHLYVMETFGGRAVGRLAVGNHPLSARLSTDGRTLYVANVGGANVVVVDVSDPTRPRVTRTLATDPHPNDLALSADGRLFVSCGNTNNVISFDLATGQRLEVISTALGPKAPAGSTPASLALSPDGERLFVANSDNNSVSVIDVRERGHARPLGFLPTGWYPTLVSVTRDGKRVIVASSKGNGTGPNLVQRPIDTIAPSVSFQHHGNLLNGLVSFVDVPDAAQLARYTVQVYENARYRDALLDQVPSKTASVIPTMAGRGSPIKHILFIVKENRTYDQVFGDIKEGNGDSTLTLFGRDVTPNQHALAEQFVLLDNLYCAGEVSQDGWPWTMSAYTTEFNERAWTLGYSRHGNVDTREVTEQSTPYIWELAKQHGLTARTYGLGGRRGIGDSRSLRFEERPADRRVQVRDPDRADRFVAEFQEMDRAGTVPNFMMMGLGENHTAGTTPGAFTPKASVASNDLAVGKIVEAITRSSVWPSFAIFIIEDDAQNGPDHVDSHRTPGLVISPYVKRHAVDSDMYSTLSMLRTMELLLGLPPMTQHDAAAPPMLNSFTTKPDLAGFTARRARIDLAAVNAPNAYGAEASSRMDFSEYDRADENTLNRILWHSIRGAAAPYPVPVRRTLPTRRGLFTFASTETGGKDNR
jgi:DNA-binding beta-propeller fold protein YncE